ncbi:MAG: hypothetical protein HYX27_23870 [Acidobacteria bacterium]|nr:hypothetical protein [Acidobacteriota bacterium]
MYSPPNSDPETQDLQEKLQARRDARAAKRSTQSSQVDPYLAAAAVQVDFDPARLNPYGTPGPGQTSASLTPVSQVIVRDGARRWSLRNDTRRALLRALAATGSITGALDANPASVANSPQQIYSSIIRGQWDYAFFSTPEQLAAALQATQWLDGLLTAVPDPAELARRLSRARFLAPFEGLARDGFVGREVELQVLNDFAGIRETSSALENTTVIFRGWLLQPKRGALIVYGMGGVGKSSLIARFILIQEGARLAFRQFPIVYIDFDNSAYSLIRSETLCMEAARQLAMQYPAAAVLYQEMVAGDTADNPAPDTPLDSERANIADFQQSLRFWENWFPRLIAAVNGPNASDPPPFLLAFDTFEEVVTRNRLAISQIFRLVDLLQSIYPALRPVICGRALDQSFGEDMAKAFQRLEIKEFDQGAATSYLLKQGVAPPDVAAALARQLGGSPLSLKLAAQAFRRGESADARTGFANLQTRSWLIFSANETVVQGQLYQRILGHIANPELRKLAHPGLVLRRLTPDLIRFVLAGPCRLNFPTDPQAQDDAAQGLFTELRKEFSLVESRGAGAVRPNNDLRRVMLALIERERPAQVEKIHGGAVDYYLQHGGTPEDRAEEIYHRLKLGQDRHQVFTERWMQEAGVFLEDAIPEFPAAVQLTLASYTGLKLPNETQLARDASLEDWERITERKIQEGIASNQPYEALLVFLDERVERSPRSPLFHAAAQLHIAHNQPALAISELLRGIESMSVAGDKRAVFTLLHLLGHTYGSVKRIDEACRAFLDAERLAREIDRPRESLFAASSYRMYSSSPESAVLLADALRRLPAPDWNESARYVRSALQSLGQDIPQDLLLTALERLSVSVSPTQTELLDIMKLIIQEAPGSAQLMAIVRRWLLPSTLL